jgi:hypothetical protein
VSTKPGAGQVVATMPFPIWVDAIGEFESNTAALIGIFLSMLIATEEHFVPDKERPLQRHRNKLIKRVLAIPAIQASKLFKTISAAALGEIPVRSYRR